MSKPVSLPFPRRKSLVSLAVACVALGLVPTASSGQTRDGSGGAALSAATSSFALAPEQDAFWNGILAMCGQAFERIDAAYIMHVRQCFADEIRIPVHVQDPETQVWDRSRTWILTRTASGIRLKHDHRHDDGSEDEVTQYGGDTDEVGTAGIQTFPADEFTRTVTGALVRGADRNIWRMELSLGEGFSYRLTRTTFDNALRWAFDLTKPVTSPPAPWGYEATVPTHGEGAP